MVLMNPGSVVSVWPADEEIRRESWLAISLSTFQR